MPDHRRPRLGRAIAALGLALGFWGPSPRAAEDVHPKGVDARREQTDEGREVDRRVEDAVARSREKWRNEDLTGRDKPAFQDADQLSRSMEDARIKATLDRVGRGEADEHRNDGTEFRNLEGRLPRREAGYYKEYVSRRSADAPVGSDRLVVGKEGDAYFTNDHYRSFRKVR